MLTPGAPAGGRARAALPQGSAGGGGSAPATPARAPRPPLLRGLRARHSVGAALLRPRGSSSTSRPSRVAGEARGAAPPRPAPPHPAPPRPPVPAPPPAPEEAARARLFRGRWVRHERRGGADAERPARAAGAARPWRRPGWCRRPRQGVGLLPAREPHPEHHGAHLQARTGCGAGLLSLPAPGEPARGWAGAPGVSPGPRG